MKEKKEVYKVKPLTERKKNIIASLIEEYDIKTTEKVLCWWSFLRHLQSTIYFIDREEFGINIFWKYLEKNI